MDHISPSKLVKGALMLTAALAVNEAAKETIKYISPFKTDSGSITLFWMYAAFVILLTIVIMYFFNNFVADTGEKFQADLKMKIEYPGGVKNKVVNLGYI